MVHYRNACYKKEKFTLDYFSIRFLYTVRMMTRTAAATMVPTMTTTTKTDADDDGADDDDDSRWRLHPSTGLIFGRINDTHNHSEEQCVCCGNGNDSNASVCCIEIDVGNE